MPASIAVSALEKFAREYGQSRVVLLSSDGETTHVVTWGRTVEECAAAAEDGNRLKKILGWPDSKQAEPSRVRKLQERIKELEAKVESLEGP